MSLATLPVLQSAGVRPAFRAYLLSIADDELILGHRHSEWTGFAPDIESDVALSSIAQEEMGHAKLFYERVGELAGGDADALAFGRRPDQFTNAVLTERPNGDWGYSIVRLYLYDRADATRLEGLASGSIAPLADLAKALRREEKYHQRYGEEWLRRLATATTDSQARVQEALNQVWPETLGLFEPVDGIERLVQEGVLASGLEQQVNQWKDVVIPVLQNLGLAIPEGEESRGGGRAGRHTDDLRILLEEMTSVWRSDPGAKW